MLVLATPILVVLLIVFTRAAMMKPETFSVAPTTPTTLDDSGAIQRFAGAIRIATVSEAGKPPNPAVMLSFRNYFQQNFPRVHATMKREVLPDGALLFTWEGSDPTKLPVILMGHMDVVPAFQWKHGPFSGDIAEGSIWGRGTIDDKIQVLASLEAAESLIAAGFTPAHTILFAFGCDEENGGAFGAQKIVKLLQSRGVRAEFVLDEGGFVVSHVIPGLERPIALIGTAEKGYVDFTLTTKGKAGHSSSPPPHTAIGQLSTALSKLENNQAPASMPEGVRQQFETLEPYLPFAPRLVLANLWLFKPLVIAFGARSPEFANSFRTTIAETMFNSGFKENALPAEARAVINFRILPGETADTVAERIRKTVNDPGVTIANNNSEGTRNPSPISPTTSTGYQTLATTIRQLFPDAIVCPFLLTAATDSSYYYVLSPNVYRFLAVEGDAAILTMMHGANEHISTDSYIKAVAFYAQLIRNIP